MKVLTIALLCALSCGRLLFMPAPQSVPSKPLANFSSQADLSAFRGTGARIALQGKAMQITFTPEAWPKAETKAAQPWDWSGYDGFALDVTNPTSRTVDFGVRVDDDPAANGAIHCQGGVSSIAPHTTQTFVLPLTINPKKFGMKGAPTVNGMEGLDVLTAYEVNLSHIVAYQIYMHQPPVETSLLVDNIRLVKAGFTMDRIVDEFGQYTRAEWPGKVHGVQEMEAQHQQEFRDLSSHPALADRDQYGAWASGPTLSATGFFYSAKEGGKWTLVAPNGHLFLSLGMDGVGTSDPTVLTGREAMFTHLPDTNGANARFAKTITDTRPTSVTHELTRYDFLQANLAQKYGPDYSQKWKEVTLARLKSWGFNTLGLFSAPAYTKNGQIPYVAGIGINGTHARISSLSDTWGKMHDPFDPQFAADVENRVRQIVPQYRNDPWCLGYFVDNELSWGGDGNGRYGLALGALIEKETSPGKQAFLAQLQAKYGDIGRLNAAWDSSFGDWNTLLNAPYKPKFPLTEAAKTDMNAFVYSLARKYFQTVHEALKQADPNHLYLGCRFAHFTPETVKAAAEFCDVISFNVYQPTIDPQRWAFLSELNKPAIVGEYHFGALDRGMFHTGLVASASQEARAGRFKEYVQSVLDNPNFVGCHWFQYTDQPLTGRWLDGENYGVGFVSVVDTPYPEMVEAARVVNQEAYTRRFGKRSASAR